MTCHTKVLKDENALQNGWYSVGASYLAACWSPWVRMSDRNMVGYFMAVTILLRDVKSVAASSGNPGPGPCCPDTGACPGDPGTVTWLPLSPLRVQPVAKLRTCPRDTHMDMDTHRPLTQPVPHAVPTPVARG